MFIPIATDYVECRADITFACPAPFVDWTDDTRYLIHKWLYTPCRGVFLNAGQSRDSTIFSSKVYTWNNFSDSTFLTLQLIYRTAFYRLYSFWSHYKDIYTPL